MNISLSRSFHVVGEMFKDLLFPPLCFNCEKIVQPSTVIPNVCQDCLGTLKPLPIDFTRVHILDRIPANHLDDLWVAYQFNPVIRELLHHIKYGKMPDLAVRMGEYTRGQFLDKLSGISGFSVIPIPLHPVRQKEREYNQSACIAKGIFKGDSCPVLENLLIRRRYTSTQTKMKRTARQRNVKEAFAVTDPGVLKGKNVVLVDDVVTTGATMNECAWLLKKNGAVKVAGIALATPVQDEDL